MQLFRTICTVELECILNGGGLRSPIAPGVPSQLLFTMVKLFWYCVVFLLLPASVCVVPYFRLRYISNGGVQRAQTAAKAAVTLTLPWRKVIRWTAKSNQFLSYTACTPPTFSSQSVGLFAFFILLTDRQVHKRQLNHTLLIMPRPYVAGTLSVDGCRLSVRPSRAWS